MSRDLANILLVEDEEIDVKLIKKAIKELGAEVVLHVTSNGEEALALLRNRATAESNVDSINLILLDVNMPKMNGREFLSELRQDRQLRRKVVVMLTSSEDERDINSCYELGANGYICKPVSPSAIRESLRSLFDFWLNNARLPS